MYRLIALLVLLFSFGVQATEPLRYVGVPVFYSKFVPKIAPCTYSKEASFGFCGWALYPEEGEIGVTTMDAKVKEAFFVRLYDEVLCIDGKCATNYTEPRGEFEDTGTAYWYIPKGFYLTKLNGQITAVKYGNGAQANKYPIRAVKILPEYNDMPDGVYVPEDQDNLTYEVWCNAGDDCSYMGRVMSFTDLRNYIPNRMTLYCDNRFCYNEDQRVAGINPKSTL